MPGTFLTDVTKAWDLDAFKRAGPALRVASAAGSPTRSSAPRCTSRATRRATRPARSCRSTAASTARVRRRPRCCRGGGRVRRLCCRTGRPLAGHPAHRHRRPGRVRAPATGSFGEPYFGAIVRGVGERAGASPFQLMLTMAGTERDRARVAAYLTEQARRRGAAALAARARRARGDPRPARRAHRVRRRGGRHRPGRAGRRPDNRAGVAGSSTCWATGRPRIALLHRAAGHDLGPQPAGPGRCDAPARGLPGTPSCSVVAFGDYSEDSGERAMREVLAAGVRPDAVFAASDLMAGGARCGCCARRACGCPTTSRLVGSTDSAVCL